MAVTASRVTVGTSAVALNTIGTGGTTLRIKNTDVTNAVDLGASTVAAGTGYPLAAGETISVVANSGDSLYAVRSAGADVVLAILRT